MFAFQSNDPRPDDSRACEPHFSRLVQAVKGCSKKIVFRVGVPAVTVASLVATTTPAHAAPLVRPAWAKVQCLQTDQRGTVQASLSYKVAELAADIPLPYYENEICLYMGGLNPEGNAYDPSYPRDAFNMLSYGFRVGTPITNFHVDIDLYDGTGGGSGQPYYHSAGPTVYGEYKSYNGNRSVGADYLIRPNTWACAALWEKRPITGEFKMVGATCGFVNVQN